MKGIYGRCQFDSAIETVLHFVMECNNYSDIRQSLRQTVEPILKSYNYVYKLKTILFPPKDLRWAHRKMILDSLCNYVQLSKRFSLFSNLR